MTSPVSSGYVRGGGNTSGWLDKKVKHAVEAFKALPPEEQEKHMQLQRESWARGEMGIGNDAEEAKAREEFRKNNPPVPLETKPTLPSFDATMLDPQAMGYTGTTCTQCQSTKVIRTGHCETCQECGNTTACA